LMTTSLTGVSVVLICISFIAKNVEHFFMYFWPFALLLKIVQFIYPLINWIVCSLGI
jgi:hypothetical protein